MLQNEKIGRHLGMRRFTFPGRMQTHAELLERWQQGNGFVAVQSQHRESFQMLATHSVCQDLPQLRSPWDIFRQHRRSGAQRNHRMGNAELHPTSSQACPPMHPLSPTARAVSHTWEGHEGDFQLLSSSLSPDFCQILSSGMLLCHFWFSGKSFHCFNNFLGLWNNLHIKATYPMAPMKLFKNNN